MADEERRITARMILDSSGFNTSLSGVNNQLRVAQSELQNASAQVGVFGRDSERLRGIQGALSSQVQLHTQRVGLYSTSLQTATTRMETNVAENGRLRTAMDSANTAFDEAVLAHGRYSNEALRARQEVIRLNDELRQSDARVQTNARQVNNYTTNLNNAQAELARIQASLNRTNTEIANQESRWLSASRALNSASEQMRVAGERMSRTGQSLTVGVTMPIVGIGVAASNMGMEFEAQMSRVKAISQATGDQFKQLNDQALQLGADTAFSAKQAADGMENLASAGFATTEIMAAMPGMLDLAASGGLEIAEASDIAASALRGFGLEATQSGHVADVLAKAAADTNANVIDMGMSMKYAAPPAHALGMGLEEVSAAIGIMANAGIKGEQAGTTLRGALVSLASPKGPATDAMKAIGMSAFDASGKMLPFKEVVDRLNESTKNLTQEKKADAIATIFGREALSGMLVLMEAGPAKIDELTKSFEGSDGAAKAMAKTMLDNTKGSMEAMKGSVETAAIKLSTVLAPSIIKVAKEVTELANKFSELSPETQETIVKSLALAAALGPIVLITGKVVTAGSAIVGVMGSISGAMGAASVAAAGTGTAVGGLGTGAAAAALLMNPITLGVLGFGAAAVGVGVALNQEVIPNVDLFGSSVSDATKKSVSAYMDLDKKVGVSLLSFQANNTTITKDIAADMVGTFEKMGTDIKVGRDKHYEEDLANLTKFYVDQGTLNSTEAQNTLAKMKEAHALNNLVTDQGLKQIAEIVAKAAAANRSATQAELDEIAAIKARMQTEAIGALSASLEEQDVILERARIQARNITTQQASEVISASAKQRDETIKQANAQYQGVVDSIARQRAEGVPISEDEANKMIAQAERKRKLSISKAQEMHIAVVDELGKQNKDVLDMLDESDGHVKKWWEKLGDWFAGNPIRPVILTPSVKEGGSHSGGGTLPKNASGTNNFVGGLTTMNERGYEVYNLPGGSRIYNHEASEDMVLKTAQEVAKGVLGNGRGGGSVVIQVVNQGTVVGSGGMYEFADIVSQSIAGKFGLSTGGAF